MREDPEMRRAIGACGRARSNVEAEIAVARVMDEVARDREGCTCEGHDAFTDEQTLGFGVCVSDRHVTHDPHCERVRREPHRFYLTRAFAELPWWDRLAWWARQPKTDVYDALPLPDRLRRAAAAVFRGQL